MRRALLTVVLALCLGACASSEVAVRNVHTVIPGQMVRGGQPDEEGLRLLKDTYGIRTVVNLNDDTSESEAPRVEALGMNYVALPMQAHDIDTDQLLAFLRIARDAEDHAPIYVHCAQGMDRTGVAIAAFRIVEQGWSAEQALDELTDYQAFVNTLFFRNIPPLVREIERDRDAWREAVEALPPHTGNAAPGGPSVEPR